MDKSVIIVVCLSLVLQLRGILLMRFVIFYLQRFYVCYEIFCRMNWYCFQLYFWLVDVYFVKYVIIEGLFATEKQLQQLEDIVLEFFFVFFIEDFFGVLEIIRMIQFGFEVFYFFIIQSFFLVINDICQIFIVVYFKVYYLSFKVFCQFFNIFLMF